MFGNTKKIVTRFAPSPTGFMHVGGARTALFAYLFARKHNGIFLLRIEDTDKAREVEGSIAHIEEALSWIGITWDFGPGNAGEFGSMLQSDRLAIYKRYAEELIKNGHAYPDPYTEEELAAFREKAKEENRPFLFRDHRPLNPGEWDGKQPLRFKVPVIKRYEWEDEVRGEMEAGEEALDDFILIKGDGYPTYNFAHIVDDKEMGVTHIFRADEFISSTPRFLSLYDALGIEHPKFVTLPPILREDKKKKLGKRDGAKDLLEYRSEGYLPEAMINFLAFIGWNPGTDQEVFTTAELIQAFDIHGIQKGGALFNEEKLAWFNREHLLRLNDVDFMAFTRQWLEPIVAKQPQFSEERLLRLMPTVRERIHTGLELEESAKSGEYDFVFTPPTPNASILQWKNDASVKDVLPRLRKVAEFLSTIPDNSDLETIKAPIWHYAEEVGKGEVLWPLRVALTGKERSPDPFTVIFIIGTAEAYKRVQHACDTILSA